MYGEIDTTRPLAEVIVSEVVHDALFPAYKEFHDLCEQLRAVCGVHHDLINDLAQIPVPLVEDAVQRALRAAKALPPSLDASLDALHAAARGGCATLP